MQKHFLNQLFEDHAHENSDLIAIIEASGDSRSITYGQLNKKANIFSRVLQKQGVKQGSVIAIMIDSNIDFIIAVLASLKLNAVYVPIDVSSPIERKIRLVSQSGSEHLVTDSSFTDMDCFSSVEIVNISECASEAIPNTNLSQANYTEELCNISYTSGTSGSPKGVMITHLGMINHVEWRIKEYDYTKEDVTILLVSNSMDGFAAILFTSFFSGGTLVLISNNKRKDFSYVNSVIKKYKITNFCIVPSMLQGLVSYPLDISLVRFIVLAGEKTSPDLIRKVKGMNPAIDIIGEYGCAESTCTISVNRNFTEMTTTYIGQPINNMKIYLLDDSMNETVDGEICISGISISKGYFKNDELSKLKFIDGAQFGVPVIYKTGDLGEKMPDGNIKYIGRKDKQLKLRGIRVELGEIEEAVFSYPPIRDVFIKEIKSKNSNSLCAFLLPKIDECVDVNILKEFLTERLPDYCVPSSFVVLDEFPLTVNGKVASDLLPRPEELRAKVDDMSRTHVQEKIIDLFYDSIGELDKTKISISDDFFDLGGNSLNVAMLLINIQKEFDKVIPFDKFRGISTVEKLESYILGELVPI